MSLHQRRAFRRQNSFLPLSGSITVSDPSPTASSLAQNTAAVSSPDITPSVPLIASGFQPPPTSTSTTPSSTPTASVTSSGSSDQISLGTVVGACVAALIALCLSVLLAFYCSKRHKQSAAHANARNAANNASRRRSHLGAWTRMDDGDREQTPMKQRPPSASLGAMFRRTNSNTSGEKSSEGYNRESVGTMRNFAKYHPGLAAEMASQGASKENQIAKPAPVLHLMNRGPDLTSSISWDGETARGDSFFSQQSGLSNPRSTGMMATERMTPTAMRPSPPRWESAEVLHVSQVGSDVSDIGELQNPFSDKASSVKSSPRGQNPFFSARDHIIKRTLPPDTHGNPFADDASRDSSDAIRSLIAALEVPDRIVSIQSSVYSRTTADDGESAVSVTAFPYPPTKINLR